MSFLAKTAIIGENLKAWGIILPFPFTKKKKKPSEIF